MGTDKPDKVKQHPYFWSGAISGAWWMSLINVVAYYLTRSALREWAWDIYLVLCVLISLILCLRHHNAWRKHLDA